MQYGFRRKKLYSIREYSPFIVAQVPMGASSGPEQRTAAFRGLAAYLFGRNETETKMQMTTPVFSSNHSMQFVLPVETEDDAPSPQADSEVQLQQVCFREDYTHQIWHVSATAKWTSHLVSFISFTHAGGR